MTPSIPIDQLNRVFADVFEIPIDKIRPDSSPDTVETWDSSRHLSLIVALEQEFGVEFEPEEIELLLSFELVESMLMKKCFPEGRTS